MYLLSVLKRWQRILIISHERNAKLNTAMAFVLAHAILELYLTTTCHFFLLYLYPNPFVKVHICAMMVLPYIDGLIQGGSISLANALGIL